MYYCMECANLFDEWDMVSGETYSADSYENDRCDNCMSDDIIEIHEEDICKFCGEYMENIGEDGERYCACAGAIERRKADRDLFYETLNTGDWEKYFGSLLSSFGATK